jgi:hypothetical protein
MSEDEILSDASSSLNTALHTAVLEANSCITDGNAASSTSDADQSRGLVVEQSGQDALDKLAISAMSDECEQVFGSVGKMNTPRPQPPWRWHHQAVIG